MLMFVVLPKVCILYKKKYVTNLPKDSVEAWHDICVMMASVQIWWDLLCHL